LEKLQKVSHEVEEEIKKIPGVMDVNNSLGEEGRPQLSLHYKRDKLYDLGLSTSYVSQLIKTAIQGSIASDIDYTRAPLTVYRKDQHRMADISFRAVGRPLGDVVSDVEKKISSVNFPSDFRWVMGGGGEDMRNSIRWLGYALIVAL